MGVLKSEYPITTITLQRWQKDWISKQSGINFSGLVQEVLTELIKQRDPAYYELYQKPDESLVRRKDMVKGIIERHPEIIPLNSTK